MKPNAMHSFLSQCYGAHRDLHSFPTRRSSDLTAGFTTSTSTGFAALVAAGFFASSPLRRAISARSALRSEEHTSELQSHVNLVCRLLLEKKKKIYGSRTATKFSL